MLFRRRGKDDPDERELTPEEEAIYREGVDRVLEERRRALEDPGPTWREWFLFHAAKWWVALGFLIVDSWIAASWIDNGSISALGWVGLVASLAAAVYLELLLYYYLWREPTEADASRSTRGFRPSWHALRERGRWTAPAVRPHTVRLAAAPGETGPDPNEFL